MIKSSDKIADLIKKYPHIKGELIKRNRIFQNLNNPVIFNTVGKFARISDVANVSREPLEDLLAFINGLCEYSSPLLQTATMHARHLQVLQNLQRQFA